MNMSRELPVCAIANNMRILMLHALQRMLGFLQSLPDGVQSGPAGCCCVAERLLRLPQLVASLMQQGL